MSNLRPVDRVMLEKIRRIETHIAWAKGDNEFAARAKDTSALLTEQDEAGECSECGGTGDAPRQRGMSFTDCAACEGTGLAPEPVEQTEPGDPGHFVPYDGGIKPMVEPKATRDDGCDKCDGPSGPKTYANQVLMPVNGKVVCVDHCIHHIVAALNAGGVGTIGSCCGHGDPELSSILLEDGRVIRVEAGPLTTEPEALEPVEHGMKCAGTPGQGDYGAGDAGLSSEELADLYEQAAPQPECEETPQDRWERLHVIYREATPAHEITSQGFQYWLIELGVLAGAQRDAAEEKLARLEGLADHYLAANTQTAAQNCYAKLRAYLDKLAAERPTPEREEQR